MSEFFRHSLLAEQGKAKLDLAVIEPHGNEPPIAWWVPPQLVDRQRQFLILRAYGPIQASPREAGEEDDGITGDRNPNLRTPVLARPHVSSIPPDHYAGSLKEFLQPIGIQRVSSSAADEGMPAA